MNKFLNTLVVGMMVGTGMLFSPLSLAAGTSIGIVNVTQLFNTSAYVRKANSDLQQQVKQMERDLQTEQKKLQDMVEKYNTMSAKMTESKRALGTKVAAAQMKLKQDTEQFQQKIKDEQNAGMEKFNTQVREATTKVAKAKNLNGVISSAAIIYADDSWVDITKDVEAAMPAA